MDHYHKNIISRKFRNRINNRTCLISDFIKRLENSNHQATENENLAKNMLFEKSLGRPLVEVKMLMKAMPKLANLFEIFCQNIIDFKWILDINAFTIQLEKTIKLIDIYKDLLPVDSWLEIENQTESSLNLKTQSCREKGLELLDNGIQRMEIVGNGNYVLVCKINIVGKSYLGIF